MNFDGTTGWSCSQCKSRRLYGVQGWLLLKEQVIIFTTIKKIKYEPLKIKNRR